MLQMRNYLVRDKTFNELRDFWDSAVKDLVVEEGPEKELENTTNSQEKHQSFMGMPRLIDLLTCCFLFKC